MSGWRGQVLKEWTVLARSSRHRSAGDTVYLAAVPGTGFIGTIRPDLTGAPSIAAPARPAPQRRSLCRAAAGQWGTRAGTRSPGRISSPSTARWRAPSARSAHFNLDVRVDATNLLNHVVFTSWNTYA